MDNEVSEDLEQYFYESDIKFQLVLPHMHQRNSAEQSVRTFKNHLISALCPVDPLLPFYLWDHILPQVNMTLNMLRKSQLDPELSPYEQLDGVQIFEFTPLSPLGCKVQIHKKTHKRLTYAPHSVYVRYLGPAVNHYTGYTCYNIDTGVDTTPKYNILLPRIYENS